MKKIILFFLSLFLAGGIINAQIDTIQPPFKKFPTYPPVELLLPDSVSIFTKNDLSKKTPVLIMLFNPECEHCRHETEEIIKHIDEFKDVEIVMATMMPFNTMLDFINKYKLAKYKNIIVGKDIHYFLPPFFAISNLPFLAFYNRKKEYINSFEGNMPIEKVIETIHK